MPTNYTDVLQLPRSILKSEDYSEGRLDESTLLALRDDVINNWDTNYSNVNVWPCRNFSGGAIDITRNRQINKKIFSQVPSIKNLVDTFEAMFAYLSIDLVWLLCNSKEGDGFQGWHKDFAVGEQITKTIVIKKEDEETTRSFNNSVSFEADDVRISVMDISMWWLRICSSWREFTVLNSPKGFWRSLPEISLFCQSKSFKDLITQSLVPIPFTFARLNALQPAVKHSHSLSDPCIC